MPVDAGFLKRAIEDELAHVSDVRVIQHVRGMLVEPHVVLLDWDYGEPGQQYPCWMVAGSIAYCESGFGPRCPWGLIGESSNSMGMDSGWYATFLDAYFESDADEIPIWKIFTRSEAGDRVALTEEASWEATWRRIMELRAANPSARYDCGHDVAYRGRKF